MILILIFLNVCHFLCDYTWLSTNWMLSAKRIGRPLFPIFVHALLHAVFMLGVVVVYAGSWQLSLFLFGVQLVTHFWIDVLKGRCNVWFPQVSSPMNKIHWVVFGFDQLLHQVVIIIMADMLCKFGDI